MSTQSTLDGAAIAKAVKKLTPEQVKDRYEKLVERRDTYLRTKQGAPWWENLDPVLISTPDEAAPRTQIIQVLSWPGHLSPIVSSSRHS